MIKKFVHKRTGNLVGEFNEGYHQIDIMTLKVLPVKIPGWLIEGSDEWEEVPIYTRKSREIAQKISLYFWGKELPSDISVLEEQILIALNQKIDE